MSGQFGWRRPAARDLIAGATVTAMLIPQAMAYAALAGLPPEVGLYASTLPLVAYAALGTSRSLAVGPVAIVSLLTASALAGVTEGGDTSPVAAAAVLATLVGLVHVAAGVLHGGRMVARVSRPALAGFTAAAAVLIGLSQVGPLIGVSVPRHRGAHLTVAEIGRRLGDAHVPTILLAVVSIGVFIALRRVHPRFPSALVLVASSVVAVGLADLGAHGVDLVGTIPESLPTIALPEATTGLVRSLLPSAFVITLVGFMASHAAADAFDVSGRLPDPDRELVALGTANLAAGLVGGLPVSGGFSRTAVNHAAGARSRWASVASAAGVLVVLLLFTPALADLPRAVLSVVIVVAVSGLVDARAVRGHLSRSGSDAASLTVTAAVTLVAGVGPGTVAALAVSAATARRRPSDPSPTVDAGGSEYHQEGIPS